MRNASPNGRNRPSRASIPSPEHHRAMFWPLAAPGSEGEKPDARRERWRKALLEACRTLPRRVNGRLAKRWSRWLASVAGGSKADLRANWSDPERSLGPFERLPEHAREALADAAFWWTQEENFLTSDVLYRRVHGPLMWIGCRLADWGRARPKRRLRGKPGARLRRLMYLCGRGLISTSLWLGRRGIALFRYTRLSQAPFLHTLWKYAGVDPADIVQHYITGIPLDPRFSPVFRVANRRVAAGALIGIDLLSSDGRLYYLESNFNPGLDAHRLKLFREGDPLGQNLACYAAARDFSRLVYFPYSYKAAFPKRLEDDWRDSAQRFGVTLEVRDTPYAGSAYDRSTNPFMDIEADGTLYVNGRSLSGPLGTLVKQKGRLENEIQRFNNRRPAEERIALPRIIASPDEVPERRLGSRFPNLMIKKVNVDQAKGISLYKTDRLPPGAGTWPNLAVEYVQPDPVQRATEHGQAEHVFRYRAYLLIGPDEAVFLGAKKDISSTPVPAELPFGRVADIRPFIANPYLGVFTEIPSLEESAHIKATVLRVGDVILEFLNRKHDLVLGGAPAPGRMAHRTG